MIKIIFLSVSIIASIVGILAYFLTPKAKHFSKIKEESIDERLRKLQQSHEARIVQANIKPRHCKIRKVVSYSVIIFYGVLSILFSNIDNPCESVMGIHVVYFMFITILSFLVILIAVAIPNMISGYKSLISGYYPPLDERACVDFISIKSFKSRLMGLSSFFYFIVMSGLFYSFHSIYISITDSMGYWELVKLVSDKCIQHNI